MLHTFLDCKPEVDFYSIWVCCLDRSFLLKIIHFIKVYAVLIAASFIEVAVYKEVGSKDFFSYVSLCFTEADLPGFMVLVVVYYIQIGPKKKQKNRSTSGAFLNLSG